MKKFNYPIWYTIFCAFKNLDFKIFSKFLLNCTTTSASWRGIQINETRQYPRQQSALTPELRSLRKCTSASWEGRWGGYWRGRLGWLREGTSDKNVSVRAGQSGGSCSLAVSEPFWNRPGTVVEPLRNLRPFRTGPERVQNGSRTSVNEKGQDPRQWSAMTA